MKHSITFNLRGKENQIYIDYQKIPNAQAAGMTALKLPFDADCCVGYPMLHAYFENTNLVGCERLCGFIQVIKREEYSSLNDEKPSNVLYELDASAEMIKHKIPYFAYGFPAEFFDSPCKNLGDSEKLNWRAYTYLIDPPSRMNGNQLVFLAGFSWGYTEDINGNVQLLDFEIVSEDKWIEHQKYALFAE